MKKKIFLLIIMFTAILYIHPAFAAGVKTKYPVFLVPGAWGFDKILGFEYFGDDFGNFVGTPCTHDTPESCNTWIHKKQALHVISVHTVQSSDYRGAEIADRIEEYMAVFGYSYVNIVGHAQGGVCIRKAARLLQERFGYPVVKVLISINSPHRGTPAAKTVLDENPDIDAFLKAVLGDVATEEGNDGYANVTSMVYDDYNRNDGMDTGTKQFNEQNPISALYARHYASILCAKNENLSPFIASFNMVIDGDGYCEDDCNGDGAAGCGDGIPTNRDDDGMIGLNSQQMGYRLGYIENTSGPAILFRDPSIGFAGDINYPDRDQMTSLNNVLNLDHFEITGYGPDSFDEMKFFGALISYIKDSEKGHSDVVCEEPETVNNIFNISAGEPIDESESFASFLLSQYGDTPLSLSQQVQIADITLCHFSKHEDYMVLSQEAIAVAFPNQSETIISLASNLDTLRLWARDRSQSLNAMSNAGRQNALREKQQEIFGPIASEIWRSSERYKKILESLGPVSEMSAKSIQERFDHYIASANSNGKPLNTPEALEQIALFTSHPSIRPDLNALDPTLRKSVLSHIRRRAGLNDDETSKLSELDRKNYYHDSN